MKPGLRFTFIMSWQPIKHIKKPFFKECYSTDLFQHKSYSYTADCCFLIISVLHPKASRVILGLFLRNVSISWRLIHKRKRAAHFWARLTWFIQKWNFQILCEFSQHLNSATAGEQLAMSSSDNKWNLFFSFLSWNCLKIVAFTSSFL